MQEVVKKYIRIVVEDTSGERFTVVTKDVLHPLRVVPKGCKLIGVCGYFEKKEGE